MTDLHTETMLESKNEPLVHALEDEELQFSYPPLSHSLEDYLEVMVDLTGDAGVPVRAVDIARKLDVSKASVSKAATSLKEKGFVDQPYYGEITLTEEGYRYGSYIWDKHQLLYRFLTEIVGIEPERANYEACQMEHAICVESYEKWLEYWKKLGLTS